METAILEYRGKQDQEVLIDFLKEINYEVKIKELHTNLYTHTNSPIDFAMYRTYPRYSRKSY